MVLKSIQGQLAEIRGLRKTLITLERNKLEKSALRRSKENNFLYRMVTLEFKIGQKMCQIFDCENVQRALTWLVDCRPIKFWVISMCPDVLFQMVKTAGLYHFPFKSYKNSAQPPYFQKWILVAFPDGHRSISWNRDSQEKSYNSQIEQVRNVDLV